MKTKDIANQYGLELEKFERFVVSSDIIFKNPFSGLEISDTDVNAVIEKFRKNEIDLLTQKTNAEKERIFSELAAEEERIALERAAAEKRAVLANMLITSGFNFDGYTITKYSGYISGDDAISVDRGWAIFGMGIDIKDKLLGSLVEIRRNALAELKEAAYALGCNAVIGVDFDYLTLDPQTANLRGGTTYMPYVFGVTANGNAVIIEKNQ